MIALSVCEDLLSRTPGVLRAWLGGLDDSIALSDYGPGTFGPCHVLGHLIAGEKHDWIPRARIMLGLNPAHGPERPFEPFDHTASVAPGPGVSVDALLDEFEALRRASLETLRGFGLTDSDLDRRGTHPAFGGVTLGQLIATWTVHDAHHVAQVAKTIGFRMREQVGPWRAYLGIIPRDAGGIIPPG